MCCGSLFTGLSVLFLLKILEYDVIFITFAFGKELIRKEHKMTTIELKSLKMDLVEELLSINDKDTLNRLKNYMAKLNRKVQAKTAASEEEDIEYISKEEILAGIDAGLKEMQERKRSGKRAKTLEDLINEL